MKTFTILIILLFALNTFAQEDTINTNSAIEEVTAEPAVTIDFSIFEMHNAYRDMTPGKSIDEFPLDMQNIKGGWRRIVSSGYYTPNGDATWEPNEVRGSIYFSESKVYYMSYPIRMHTYADYKIDDQNNMRIFNQKVLPDSLDWFRKDPGIYTKDSLSILYFDGQYYMREQMEHDIVLELEQRIIQPEALIGNWVKTDTLSCCYGTTYWQEYPWDMPEDLHISKTWANKIYKKQKIYIQIENEFKPFYIAELGDYTMEIEAGSWFIGKADRVVYHRRWD